MSNPLEGIRSLEELVKDWSVKFKQVIEDKPTNPTLEIRRLRANLIQEEFFELLLGLGFKLQTRPDGCDTLECCEPNLNQVADGCGDLIWVTIGTLLACGISTQEIMEKIYESNMTKLWTTEEVHVCNMQGNKDNLTFTQICKDNNRCYLVQRLDGKVIKSPSYTPVQFNYENISTTNTNTNNNKTP